MLFVQFCNLLGSSSICSSLLSSAFLFDPFHPRILHSDRPTGSWSRILHAPSFIIFLGLPPLSMTAPCGDAEQPPKPAEVHRQKQTAVPPKRLQQKATAQCSSSGKISQDNSMNENATVNHKNRATLVQVARKEATEENPTTGASTQLDPVLVTLVRLLEKCDVDIFRTFLRKENLEIGTWFVCNNMAFLQHIQIRMRGPGRVNIFQWHSECLFFRHVEFNLRFDVMTIDEIPFHLPKDIAGFRVIFCFCRLRPHRVSQKFFREVFAHYNLIRPSE